MALVDREIPIVTCRGTDSDTRPTGCFRWLSRARISAVRPFADSRAPPRHARSLHDDLKAAANSFKIEHGCPPDTQAGHKSTSDMGISMRRAAVPEQLTANQSANTDSLCPSQDMPGSSQVEGQELIRGPVLHQTGYVQVMCPQCSTTFPCRLIVQESGSPDAGVQLPLPAHGPRIVMVSRSNNERQTSFRPYTRSSNSASLDNPPQPVPLAQRLPMKLQNSSFPSFGVRHACPSVMEGACEDERNNAGFAAYAPEVLQAPAVESLHASRAAMRQSAFSTRLAGMRMHDYYELGRRINSGLSAEVFEATERATGSRVALKVYFNSDRAAVHETITEHVCMSRAACDLVLRCHGIVFDGSRPVLVLDLAQQSLRDYLQEAKKQQTCSEDEDGRSLIPFTSYSTRASDKPEPDQDQESEASGNGKSASLLGGSSALDSQHEPPRMSARQSDFLKHSHIIPLAHVMKFTASLLEAVLIIHRSGLAHCDIKPENIMIMEDGTIRVCDFGASAAIDPRSGRVAAMPIEINELEQQLESIDSSHEGFDSNAQKANADSVMAPYTMRKVTQGTESYNAPERSNKADMRKADVWAIGCVLYELCTGGQPLFTWHTEREKYMQLAQLYDPSWKPPQVPAYAAGWQEAIDAMLAVDPVKRLLPEDVLKLPIFEKMYRRPIGLSIARSRRSMLIQTTSPQPVYQAERRDATCWALELPAAVTM
eukprot:jgi/Ulvmu1/7191/UM034_0100.1